MAENDWLRLLRLAFPRWMQVLLLGLPLGSFAACATADSPAPTRAVSDPRTEPDSPAGDEPLQPLPPTPQVDPRRAALGARLFENAALSGDGSVACATCHPLDRAGSDGLRHSRGALGVETALNTPTIYNATFNFRFNWNGAFSTLEDELDAPVTRTMGTSWEAIKGKLRDSPELAAEFETAYADGITTANVKDALARFIDTLTTPHARFDQYLRGDLDALSPQEYEGYVTFKKLGCATCHQGANVGGNMFQRIGVMRDYFEVRQQQGGGPIQAADMGRFSTTQSPADRYVFRVPSLRNVALTPPYFHDGSAATLEIAVERMGVVQLGQTLSGKQVADIVAFLNTLTGQPQGVSAGHAGRSEIKKPATGVGATGRYSR